MYTRMKITLSFGLILVIISFQFTLPVNGVNTKELPVIDSISAHALADNAFRLIWDQPNTTDANIMYLLHINEVLSPWTEEKFCLQVMPGLLKKDSRISQRIAINATDSPPAPISTSGVTCIAVTSRTKSLLHAPRDGQVSCFIIKDRTHLTVPGFRPSMRYFVRIQACFDTVLGLCGHSVSVKIPKREKDPYTQMRRVVMKGNEPADAAGTLLLMEWTVPTDDSLRAFAVILRLDNKKAVVLCRPHAEIQRRQLKFAVLIVGPGYCRVSVRAASSGGWHKWHNIGGFYPRSLKEKYLGKNEQEGLQNEIVVTAKVKDTDANSLFSKPEEIVSFTAPGAHIAIEPIELGRTFDWQMKMRTKSQDGLLMYMANTDQSVAMSVSIVGGKVVIVVDPGGNKSTLASEKEYNDGAWHEISFLKYGGRLVLRVDNTTEVHRKSYSGNKRLDTRNPVYLGGTPPDYEVLEENVGTKIGFVGCISDVGLKGKKIDFAKSVIYIRKKHISISDRCDLVKYVPSVADIRSVTYTEDGSAHTVIHNSKDGPPNTVIDSGQHEISAVEDEHPDKQRTSPKADKTGGTRKKENKKNKMHKQKIKKPEDRSSHSVQETSMSVSTGRPIRPASALYLAVTILSFIRIPAL